MTIQELINIIPFEILHRGQNYYQNGNILQLNKSSDGTWYAEVEGNYGNYEVEIKPDKNSDSANYYCDCPYDGTICKHIAAIALAIDEENTINISSNEKESDKVCWEQLINDANPKELKAFLIEYGKKNKDFRHKIKLAFAKPVSVEDTDNIAYYQSQINGIFDNYDYHGFIDYRSSYKSMNDVAKFQIMADDYYANGNLNEAFSISAAIAMEGVKAIQYMDDSSGQCGGAIYDAFNIIDNTLSNNKLSEKLKERIFNWLHEQVQNSDYRNFGVGDSLEPLFFETATSLQKLELAYKFIDAKIIELDKEDGWSKKYNLQRYLGEKINLLQYENRITEADYIIDSYLHFENFRKIRVEQAIEKNNAHEAEKLILEGIKIAQKDSYSGIVHNWKDKLLELYGNQKNTTKYSKLARELFIENTSNIEYFRIFKKTCKEANWIEKRNKLIDELKNKNRGYYRGISVDDLAHIYIEEQLIDELFELVGSSNSIHTVIVYTKYLKDKYPTELLEYYKAAIEIQAEQTGRDVYVSLVDYLKQMAKLKGGLFAAKELKASLLNNYKNRPAMKDEFNKLNWD